MKKYFLYGHDGSANHGCEALARTTAELLDCNKNLITLISAKPKEDFEYEVSSLCSIVERGGKVDNLKKDINFWRAFYFLKIKKDFFPMDALFEIQKLGLNRRDVAIAIGGDSYCYSGYMRDLLYHQHRVFQTMNMKTVLWGCSIESHLLKEKKLLDDLQTFDLITARESISYELLKKINKNTILVSDSAFLLKEKRLPLPDGYEGAEIVGINSSPLIERRETIPGIARKNVENLIEFILEKTHFKIMLIPHVVWPTNDDRIVLQELFDKYKDSSRVTLIGDYNCEELKGYISRCSFFIGARTHSSIAAYSSGIPTLVLGYSTKAKGIAKDLFGEYENYVVSVQDLKSDTDLTEKGKWLFENGSKCRAILKEVIPNYSKRVYAGVEALNLL